jgi:hypothetical protein
VQELQQQQQEGLQEEEAPKHWTRIINAHSACGNLYQPAVQCCTGIGSRLHPAGSRRHVCCRLNNNQLYMVVVPNNYQSFSTVAASSAAAHLISSKALPALAETIATCKAAMNKAEVPGTSPWQHTQDEGLADIVAVASWLYVALGWLGKCTLGQGCRMHHKPPIALPGLRITRSTNTSSSAAYQQQQQQWAASPFATPVFLSVFCRKPTVQASSRPSPSLLQATTSSIRLAGCQAATSLLQSQARWKDTDNSRACDSQHGH